MEQALSLPEIINNISLFIHPDDYSSFSLVSRAWFESIAPWIWHTITLQEMDSVEDLAILHKNRALLRELNVLEFVLPIDICGWFDHLQALYCSYNEYQPEALDPIAKLIRRNRSSLRSIHVICPSGDNSIILRTSHECPSLKDLQIGNFQIRDRDLMECFMKICTRLTTLSLEDVEFEEGTHLMWKDQLFTSLERVMVDGVHGPYQDLWRACPNLKVLSIYELLDANPEEFVETVTTHCKQLCVLSCHRSGTGTVGNFEKIVQTMPLMRYLQAVRTNMFQFTPYTLYTRHYESLQAIEMMNQSKDDGTDTQIILSSCPNLRWFEGDFIFAEDIESGSPWVCQRLEHLQVEILVRNTDRHLDSVACAQLSQLKRIRTLNLSIPDRVSREDYQHRSLSLRLSEGLELLASLSKLEHFGVGNLRPECREEWRAEDIEWMAQAWPNLEAIYYNYHEDEMYSRLCKQLGVSRVRQHYPWSNYMDFIDL